MLYMTITEASKKWNVSLRQAQRLVAVNRIPNAQKFGRVWMIPSDAKKPVDLRKSKTSQKSKLSDLRYVIDATTVPMPIHDPDGILSIVNDDRLRIAYESELYYLRGDFRQVIQCFCKTKGDEVLRLRIAPLAIASSISLGDTNTYANIEDWLKNYIEANQGDEATALAELSLATAAVSMIAPDMAPGWLKSGALNILPPSARPNALYLRAKYFQCIGKTDTMLAVAQSALALSSPEQGFTTTDLYLRITCAVALNALGQKDESEICLLDAMRTGLPHGFITPFAETVTAFGGLIEHCLKQEFPDFYDGIMKQWEPTWKNWITFHNKFTKDNITLILTLREYHIAVLAARRVPYSEIAKHYHISVGRLKNIILEIYEKLFISSRDELSKYVL